MEEDKKETKDEKPETAEKEITDKEADEKEVAEKEKRAKAEKELAEKEATEKAEKKAKAKPAKKKANKKRTKKKKAVKKADDPKRIRMLMSIANEKVAYTAGDVYEVGKDITLDDAKKRLREGVAELDASAEGPSETK